MTLRVTVDTNILVSHFLVPGGNPSKVLELARQGRMTLVLSDPILDEMEGVLEEKLKWPPEQVRRARHSVEDIIEIVRPHHSVSVVREDEADNRILECALSGRAEVLVPGDRHLLSLKKHRGVRIMNPRDFLENYLD